MVGEVLDVHSQIFLPSCCHCRLQSHTYEELRLSSTEGLVRSAWCVARHATHDAASVKAAQNKSNLVEENARGGDRDRLTVTSIHGKFPGSRTRGWSISGLPRLPRLPGLPGRGRTVGEAGEDRCASIVGRCAKFFPIISSPVLENFPGCFFGAGPQGRASLAWKHPPGSMSMFSRVAVL